MDLKCAEMLYDTVDNTFAQADRTMKTDVRIIQNLLDLERTTLPTLDYFAHVQCDLKPYMRKIVTTWMLEVSAIRVL
jgi:Cyclin, N-terminal domain